jgi:hypothetical protein
MNSQSYPEITADDYYAISDPSWPSYEDFLLGNNVEEYMTREINEILRVNETLHSDTFCVLPFYGIELPLQKSCCFMKGEQPLTEVREQMLSNIRPTDCTMCWDSEDRNVQSDRHIKNQTFDHYLNKDIKTLQQECINRENKLISFKIDTSNKCNATCITCNSKYSSSWAKLLKKNGQSILPPIGTDMQTVEQYMDYSTVKSIIFRGGESLLSDVNFDIVGKLLEKQNTDCFISFVTNGSIFPSVKQMGILSNFQNINFNFSIDGISEVFEYLRYPLKWDKVLTNIKRCREMGIDVSSTFTISNLNIYYYDAIIEWFEYDDIPFFHNFVSYPTYFSINSLPAEIKKEICLKNPSVNGFFNEHSASDDEQYKMFITQIRNQDKWKGTDIKDYLPEFCNIIHYT